MSTVPVSNKTIELSTWLVQRGLEGATQLELLDGYCRKLLELEVPLMRFHAAQTALHPVYGGTGYSWYRETGGDLQTFSYSDEPPEAWTQSPLYALLDQNLTELRERIIDQNTPSRFPLLNDLRQEGATDYVAKPIAFGVAPLKDPTVNNEDAEGVLMSWTSDGPQGFDDADMALINDTLPELGLGLKAAKADMMAQDLMRVYLGRDAGERVLSGEIRRGSLQQIDAVIWNFDLEGFTSLSEAMPGTDIIHLLNDYLAVAVAAIENHGGSVLKFMGDGILAMFDVGTIKEDVIAALDASAELRATTDKMNEQRRKDGLPVVNYTLALHAGEILYGNIGADSRLDFTVIGPAVNQTARIAGMHKSLGQRVILSDDVAKAAGSCVQDLVSLGRYMLRGVPEPKELFTIYTPAG